MSPTERATLAVAEHYSRRAAELASALVDHWAEPSAAWYRMALRAIERARRAELLDPQPSPITMRLPSDDPH